MNIRVLLRLIAVLVLAAAVWGGWKLTHLWRVTAIGPYVVRRNALTEIVQVRDDSAGEWLTTLRNDPYAPAVPPGDVKLAKLGGGVWGEGGILCGRVVNSSTTRPIQGRVAFHVNVFTFDGKRYKDRTLRTAVDWPAGASVPIVLNTGLPTPTANQHWTVTLEPVLASGETAVGD